MSIKEALTKRYSAKGLTNEPEKQRELGIENVTVNRASISRTPTRTGEAKK